MTLKVPEVSALTAQGMLDLLNITDSSWTSNSEWKCPWVFRGQRDSRWSLTPSAWRDSDDELSIHIRTIKHKHLNLMRDQLNAAIRSESITKNVNPDWITEAYTQARAEFEIINEFIELSDSLGFQVPDSDEYTRLAHHSYIPDIRNIPNTHLLPGPNSASAFAQHHGIPTRGLDWTKDPLVAAYFACQGMKESKHELKISVWAIQPDKINEFGRAHQFNDDHSRFLGKTFPKSKNEYLKAQDGILVYPTYGCQYFIDNGYWPDFEQFAIRLEEYSKESLIKKFTLSYEHVDELLRLLWIRNISKAHLMPTFDNVTDALKDKWKWNPMT